MAQLEKVVEARLRDGVKARGGLALKFVSPGMNGVPDRIVLMPCGRMWFVELKQTEGRLRPTQVACHRLLSRLGFDVRTLYGAEDVDRFLEEAMPNELLST